MSRLTRYTQLLFGSTAGTNQIAEFGSLANSSPARYSGSTITPALIQNLGQYLSGWFSAVIGQNSQTIEDLNALCYLFSYQLGYLMQSGVPEYDTGTTYYTSQIAMSGGYLYVSLTDSNLNNPVTDPSHWAQVPQNGMVTPNTIPSSVTVTSGHTLSWPNLTVSSGKTLTISSGAYFQGKNTMIVNGTFAVSGTSIIS